MITISIHAKGARLDSVLKLVEEVIKAKYPEASVSGSRYEAPESRPERFSEAMSKVSDAKSDCESLRDELQEWYNNLPDGFRDGQKGDDLQSAIDELEEVVGNLEDAEGHEVSFPGMFG